jgi:hypothetical protein
LEEWNRAVEFLREGEEGEHVHLLGKFCYVGILYVLEKIRRKEVVRKV